MAALKPSSAHSLLVRLRWACLQTLGATGRVLGLRSRAPVAALLLLVAAIALVLVEQRLSDLRAERLAAAPPPVEAVPSPPRADPRQQTLQELDALAVAETDLPEVLAASLAVWEAHAWTVSKVDYQWQSAQLGGLGRVSLHMSLSGPAENLERAVQALLLNQRALAVESFQVQREGDPSGRLGLQLVLQLLYKPAARPEAS